MKIFMQLLKEFWLPLLLSIFWVLYNVLGSKASTEWTIQRVGNIFGPTFFLLSWMTGQFFRVKKQSKVEDSFEMMEARFESLFREIEGKTNSMIGHITGGDSFSYLEISSINTTTNMGILLVIHKGEHPLYDVSARIVDLQKFAELASNLSMENVFQADTIVPIGNLSPSQAVMLRKWTLEHDKEQSYNVFISARNGNFTQLIRLRKVNDVWVSATKVTAPDQEILFEKVSDGYPKNGDGNVVWE